MISLIVFLPLFGFLVCTLSKKYISDNYAQIITTSLLLLSAIFSWIIFIQFLNGEETKVINLINWIKSGSFSADWTLRVDALTATMFIVVTTVSACVHLYSIGYMNEDKSIKRFMGYLSLFTFFMLMLVTSNNLLQMFFGWEGVGLASYLLIGFWHHKDSANKAAMKAFIVNRVGDFGFAIGIVAIYFIFGSVDFEIIFKDAQLYENQNFIFLGLELSIIDTICFLLFIGAMGKSAQLGLHTWLPDAMEGPTPVSALIHAATMVTAGVFMVARMSPLFELAAYTNLFIIFIGASTAIFAASIALTQNDIKRVIAYSTCSQLGYMFFATGIGAYNSAIFHLMTHGFFKALLFLSAGSVIHSMHHEQDMRKMGGLFKKIPFTGSMMWIGSLAIIGFPYFSGYYSKESILENAYFASSSMAQYAYIVGILTALLTAFYSWRLLFLTFHGSNRSSKDLFINVHEPHQVMTFPLLILAVGSIFSGMVLSNYFIGDNQEIFWHHSIVLYHGDHHYMPFIQTFIIKTSVAIGVVFAAFLYFYNDGYSKKLSHNLDPLYTISFNKWYIDELYNHIFVKPFFYLASFFWKKGDIDLIDSYGPNGASRLINLFSKGLSLFQSGYLYHYAFAMLGGLVIILTWFIYY